MTASATTRPLGPQALRLGLVNVLLTSKGLKFSPVAFLYYVAPLCAATLLIPWLATELPSLSHHHFRAVRRTGPLTLLANASVAFLLNLVRPHSWRESGALLLSWSVTCPRLCVPLVRPVCDDEAHQAHALLTITLTVTSYCYTQATMALIKHTSALTLNVSGVFKDLLLIVYSVSCNGRNSRGNRT